MRDRLGLDWFNRCPENDSPTLTQEAQLLYRKKEQQQQLDKHISSAAATLARPNDGVVPVTSEMSSSVPSPAVSSTVTRMRNTAVGSAMVDTEQQQGAINTQCITEPHKLAAAAVVEKRPLSLKDYVHSKYGVPMDQLSRVFTNGLVTGVEVDSSGCGRGPIIRAPVEASVLLPTPLHTPLTTLGLEPHSPHTTHTSHTPLQQHNPVGSTAANTTHMSHTSHHRPTTPQSAQSQSSDQNGLTFEARFECGNLDKTKQM